jgi:hypothetical protein
MSTSNPASPAPAKENDSVVKKIFVGVMIAIVSSLATGFITWAKARIPVGNQFRTLQSFDAVLEEATNVIDKADGELWVAVDTPPYGVRSVGGRKYSAYRTALSDASSREMTCNVLWFSRDFERKYGIAIGGATEEQADKAMIASDAVRTFFPNVPESELPALSFSNFWVAREKSGKYHVVLAWFFFGGDSEPEMRGVYSTSEELATMAIEVWRHWKTLSETREMNKLKDILPSKTDG